MQVYTTKYFDIQKSLSPYYYLHLYNQVKTKNRNKLMKYLSMRGIQKIYHIPLASEAPVFKKYRRFKTPVARKVLNRFLSIPAHEKMTSSQQFYVIDSIKNFFKKN